MHYTILCLAGDGIGPEVCKEAKKVISWFNENKNLHISVEDDLVGGACYDKHKVAVRDETVARAKEVDAVLLGAVGGPQYDHVARDARPEAGLLKLRKDLDLFANLRPAMTFAPLLGASTLKEDIIKDLDILILRELTAGVYFGEPRGMQNYQGQERCVDTQAYTKDEVTRIAILGFELAQKRGKMLHSVEKANVMETGIFWRNIVSDIHEKQFQDVTLHHMYADNCAMQLVRNPKQFDVIVTDNLFGDILSDAAAMCTGSLGMLPSASLGAKNAASKQAALYEPVHGSAPDIAGKGLANPLAVILSVAMMFKYSFSLTEEARLLEQAVNHVLAKNKRTHDIKDEATVKIIGTEEMGNEVIASLKDLSK